MENIYLVEICNFPGITSVTESDIAYNVGDIVSIIMGEGFKSCVRILGESDGEPGSTIYKSYSNCESCLNDPCNLKFFTIQECGTENEPFSLPSVTTYYTVGTYVQYSGSCYTVVSNEDSLSINGDEVVVSLPTFESCEDCNNNKFVSRTVTPCGGEEQNYGWRTYCNSSINSGDTISFNINGFVQFCGVVGDIVTGSTIPNPHPHWVVGKVENCESCNNSFTPRTLIFTSCTDGSELIIIPTLSVSNQIDLNSGTTFSYGVNCYGYKGEYLGDECIYTFNTFNFDGSFDSCFECNQPLSGGSEYFACVICSGTSITVTVPHPTWTLPNGKAIVLLDAVQLGGMNGLNS